MTRKHFEAVARMFHETLSNPTVGSSARVAVIALVHQHADYFASENPRFDRERFIAACVTGEN